MISYEVYLQMVEICNEQLQDLLDEDSAIHGESSFSDVSLHSVKSAVDAVNLVKHGRTKYISTAVNNQSSYSHRSVIQKAIDTDTCSIRSGRFFIWVRVGSFQVWSIINGGVLPSVCPVSFFTKSKLCNRSGEFQVFVLLD